MVVDDPESEHDDLHQWTLDEWDTALFRRFFAVPPKVPAPPLVRLCITGEDLRAACAHRCAAGDARAAFIESVKRALGRHSLAFGASRRRDSWNPESAALPPFLSHLLLTCMVANDLADELRWTGNFRERLCHVLGTHSQPQLERLRPLWEDLAAWSVRQNLAGIGCRQLRLPRIPGSGYHSIIGYSVRLAVPSRRDQSSLAALFRRNDLEGREPTLNSVLHVVSANVGKFSSDFGDVFNDFVTALKSQPLSALFHTTFWTAVREICLSGVHRPDRGPTAVRIRLELEDDDGQFWLALTSDTAIQLDGVKTVAVPHGRESPFQFILTDRDGNGLVSTMFSSSRIDPTVRELANIRSAIAEGLLLFEEGDDYVFVLSSALPASGQLRCLVSDQLKEPLMKAVASLGVRPEVTRSMYAGWSEWRGLTVEGLRRLSFSRFPALACIRSLRVTIPPPEIKLRGGIRVGSSFVALSEALPLAEVPGAERVILDLGGGEWEDLERLAESEGAWCFAPTLVPARLIGSRRIVALAESVPIAERRIDFIESAFTTDYKEPLDPRRWLVESIGIDTVPFSDGPICTAPLEEKAGPERESNHLTGSINQPSISAAPSQTSLIRLMNLLCARSAAQRGISEGELIPIMTGELGVKVSEIWAILRAWVEAGMLEALTDARWRARTYFGRTPQLVVHRRFGQYEAVLTGLVPPFLLERFDKLSIATGIIPVEQTSVSPFVPALPRCRSHHLRRLSEIARELNLAPVVRVRPLEDFLGPVLSSAELHSSTVHDSWPVYRRWDWKRRVFSENPPEPTRSGISIEWCRRDDGPDRYKLYQDGSLLWWTRSRTWAVLSAFTLACVPVFSRQPGSAIESQGDSLYLPLPAARVVSWIGPVTAGPVKVADGQGAYRYTFPDERSRELVVTGFWPDIVETTGKRSAVIGERLAAILRTGGSPLVPLPVHLRRALRELCGGHALGESRLVPALALPQLYAVIRSLEKGAP